MSLTKITTKDEFDNIVNNNDKFLLFKNSTTCPISRQAFNEYQKFTADQSGPFYFLNVQESRDLSQWIASNYSVRHESPQALLFKDNAVVWNDSHFSITYDALNKQWK